MIFSTTKILPNLQGDKTKRETRQRGRLDNVEYGIFIKNKIKIDLALLYNFYIQNFIFFKLVKYF